MRRVLLFITSSLDGFIARPKGEIDWLFTDQDYGYKKFLSGVDTLIMGRKTYELCLTFGEWPYSDKKCYVLTHRPKKMKTDLRVEFISDAPALVKKLRKEKSKKNIWLVGGAELVALFLNAKLLDEILLFLHPLLLGKGIPLFQGIQSDLKLTLKKTHAFDSGMVLLHYMREK